MKHRLAFSSLIAFCVLSAMPHAHADNSGYVREISLEQARAKDFHRHEIAAQKYDEEREAHVDAYKTKQAKQEVSEEAARKAYIAAESRRKKGISDDELDEILRQKLEREAAAYESSREAFVHLRDQIEAAHHTKALDENEEYGL